MGVTKKHCFQAMLLLLAVVALFSLLLLVPWWNKLSFYDLSQQKSLELLETYNAMLGQQPELEMRLSAAETRLKNSELFFRSATAELAGAELQRRIKTLVDATDATLTSTQNLGVTTESGQTKIAVRVRLSGNIEALSKILYELETEAPIAIIENLSMRAKRISTRRNKQRQIEHAIDVNFDLIGFLRMQDK